MPRKVEPPEVEVVIDDSSEARVAYLDALKIVVRDVLEKRRRQAETNKLQPPRIA